MAERDKATAFVARYMPELGLRCDVCGSEAIESLRHCKQNTGGEHYKKTIACTHFYCAGCLERWIESNVNSMSLQVRCPDPGCRFVLYPDDVKRLCSPELQERYVALSQANYRARLSDIAADGIGAWVAANCRLCPSCNLMVNRSEGCNSMRCICGTAFNYAEAQAPQLSAAAN